jgi:hypothetical protein
MLRDRGVSGGTASADAADVTVLMVAVPLCAAAASVTLEGRMEQEAHIAATTGEQFRTTVPPKPPAGVTLRL